MSIHMADTSDASNPHISDEVHNHYFRNGVRSLSYEEECAFIPLERTFDGTGEIANEHFFAHLVNRRAPLNPLKSKYTQRVVKKTHKRDTRKISDPAQKKIGITGKLTVAISTSALLFWCFLFEHVVNYTLFGGKCVGQVLYPHYTLGIQPFIVDVGYGSCEYNTGLSSSSRCSVGSCSSFKGYPQELVRNHQISSTTSSWDSFNLRTYFPIGALDTNLIRNYGETFRVFWAMYLHSGWLHILLNVSTQAQLLYMLEPDWGSIKVALLFFLSGMTGNLLSAVADPCSITVGSSGALYGLLGALIPYCIEYWKTIPRPVCFLCTMFAIIVVGIIIGMTGITDNYAHMGGCLGGILFGFSTIRNVSALDKCTLIENILLSNVFRNFISDAQRKKLIFRKLDKKKEGQEKRMIGLVHRKTAVAKKKKLIEFIKRLFDNNDRINCTMNRREWIVRGVSLCSLVLICGLLFGYLLVPNLYRNSPPPGNLKFSGYKPCYCCEIFNSGLSGNDLVQYNLGWGAGRLYGLQGKFWCWSSKKTASNYCNIDL